MSRTSRAQGCGGFPTPRGVDTGSLVETSSKGITYPRSVFRVPPPKSRKNAHMKRSSLKLFFAKNQVPRRILTSRLTNTSEKVETFYSKPLKHDKNTPKISVWSWVPVMAILGVPKTTLARFSIPPYPNLGKKGGFGKLILQTFFLHLSARSWTIITL